MRADTSLRRAGLRSIPRWRIARAHIAAAERWGRHGDAETWRDILQGVQLAAIAREMHRRGFIDHFEYVAALATLLDHPAISDRWERR